MSTPPSRDPANPYVHPSPPAADPLRRPRIEDLPAPSPASLRSARAGSGNLEKVGRAERWNWLWELIESLAWWRGR